jgi:hypothetical protein
MKYFPRLRPLALLGLAFSLFACVSTAPPTDTRPIITVSNDTGYDIHYLYISLASSNNWEVDLLGDDILSSGRQVPVRLPQTGIWDLRAEDEDGDHYSFYGLEINEDYFLTINFDDLDIGE